MVVEREPSTSKPPSGLMNAAVSSQTPQIGTGCRRWQKPSIRLELQCMAGTKVTFGKTGGTGEVGHCNMVFEYTQRDILSRPFASFAVDLPDA